MELGYEQSGSVCNLLEFFKSLRAFLNINAENDDDIKSFYMLSTASTQSRFGEPEVPISSLIGNVRDILYAVNKPLDEIYAEFKQPNGLVDRETFQKLIRKYSKKSV